MLNALTTFNNIHFLIIIIGFKINSKTHVNKLCTKNIYTNIIVHNN